MLFPGGVYHRFNSLRRRGSRWDRVCVCVSRGEIFPRSAGEWEMGINLAGTRACSFAAALLLKCWKKLCLTRDGGSMDDGCEVLTWVVGRSSCQWIHVDSSVLENRSIYHSRINGWSRRPLWRYMSGTVSNPYFDYTSHWLNTSSLQDVSDYWVTICVLLFPPERELHRWKLKRGLKLSKNWKARKKKPSSYP